MTMTFVYAILAAMAVSFVSLVGVFTFLGKESINSRVMHVLVALAAGAMLGNALLHLVPHSISLEAEWLEKNPGFVEYFHGQEHDDHAPEVKTLEHEASPGFADKHEHEHEHLQGHDHDAIPGDHVHAHDNDHNHGAVPGKHDHDHDVAPVQQVTGHDHGDVPGKHDHDHDVAPGKQDNDHDHAHGGHMHTGLLSVFLVVAGLIGFMGLHTTLLKMSKTEESGRLSEGWLIAFGDGMENFLDGMVIGAAFLISVPVGIAATLTIVLHEIPLEAGDFAVIRHAGFSRGRALLLNFFSGLLSVVGAAVAVIVGMVIPEVAFFFTPIAAGAFLYIAGAILIPHVREIGMRDGRGFQYMSIIMIGITLMALVLLLE